VVLGPNNKPVGAAEITAIASQRNMGINMMTAFSDFAGEFEIDDAAPGTVINAKFGDLVSGEGVKATSADKPLTIRLIRNAWASLVGQVNDSNGQPVPNADITVFRQIGNMGNSIASAKTNASGKYRIDNLYPGFAYSVSASHDKLASDSTGDSPVAKPHESISMPSIVMQKLDSFVAGVVLDPNGAPAVGYTVSYQEANPQPKCITDSNGKFRLDGLPSGHVELLILSATGTGTGFYETSGKTDIKIHFPDIDADNHTQPLYNPKLTVGAAPIDFTATDMNGDAIALSGLKGKVVVLDFWATWCNWSVHELPDIIDLDKQYRQKGVEVIGISLDRDKTDLQKMIDQKGISYPQVFDENGWSGAIPNLYKITAIPFNIVIGKDGLIAGVNLRRADLNQAVLKALGDK
jgi:peroxiredoxin